jgi:hypothetical protein
MRRNGRKTNQAEKAADRNTRRRVKNTMEGPMLPVLILGLGELLVFDDEQGDEDPDEPEQHDEPGKIELHGRPPRWDMFREKNP